MSRTPRAPAAECRAIVPRTSAVPRCARPHARTDDALRVYQHLTELFDSLCVVLLSACSVTTCSVDKCCAAGFRAARGERAALVTPQQTPELVGRTTASTDSSTSRWCAGAGGGVRARRMCACSWRLHALTALLVLAAHLIKVLSCGEVGGAMGAARLHKRYVGLYTGPYFDPSAPNNITTQLGTHAYLPCKVRQLSNKSVSWIRRRDAHILTVDRFTFIADERFQAFLVEATDTWTLQVKYVQARDAGVYECQVGTEPKMSHFVQLNVVVPKIEIMGESDLYVKAGSTVSLKCVITQALEEPAYIFWYHNEERVLNYDRSLVEIRMERVAPDTTVGNLIIYSSRREDSGNYSCAPSNLDSASVVLHVLSGEQPAAMQHGNASPRAARPPPPPALLAALAAALLVSAPRAHAHTAALLATSLALMLMLCHDEDERK